MPGGPRVPGSPLIGTVFVSPISPGAPLEPSREQLYYYICYSHIIVLSYKNIKIQVMSLFKLSLSKCYKLYLW